jgi:hypothetical protein
MDEDYDFWEEHPDPSDEDIADLPRAASRRRATSRDGGQQKL